MKKRIVAIMCALSMLATSQAFMPATQVQAAQVEGTGTTYYFSSKNGDNSNSGTSKNKPWQTLDKLENVKLKAGDKILLEAGSIFNGFIHSVKCFLY